MKLLKEMNKKESGQALILVLILLLVGGLIIAPLLAFMSTGLIVGRVYEQKMDEVYAADAGVEDAIYNIITPAAPYYEDLQDLNVNEESNPYDLTVNDLSVSYTVTKLALISGLIDDSEYKLDQPHADWVDFTIPEDEIDRNYDEGWVEYYCEITFYYDGTGNRTLQTVGAFFSPIAGDQSLVDGPYGYEGTETGVMDFAQLESGSPETKFSSGGFAFIWRWESNQGPLFDQNNRDGAFSFKFKVYDPDWEYTLYFVWATFKEQDISYVTNAPDLYRWLIEATAGDTEVRSLVLDELGTLDILTWEINPQ